MKTAVVPGPCPAGGRMIELVNVSACQQQLRAIDRLSLFIGEGERVAILGPNGAGKSTLLKLISREIYPLDEPGSSLKLFGSETVNLWDLRSRIGFVSQDLQEDYTPYTSALDVVVSGFFGAIGTHDHLQPTAEQVELGRAMLAAVEMSGLETRMFQRLSTGQKRRLLLARALVHQPRALILDEPASGLDMGASLTLLALLRRFCGEGHAMIITTHHIDEIIPEIDRVVLIDQGRIVVDGAKAEVLTSERLSALYRSELRVEEQGGWYRCWHA
ncbi:putative ABC transporter ATP-binding protein YlmA [compost metagenome]